MIFIFTCVQNYAFLFVIFPYTDCSELIICVTAELNIQFIIYCGRQCANTEQEDSMPKELGENGDVTQGWIFHCPGRHSKQWQKIQITIPSAPPSQVLLHQSKRFHSSDLKILFPFQNDCHKHSRNFSSPQ